MQRPLRQSMPPNSRPPQDAWEAAGHLWNTAKANREAYQGDNSTIINALDYAVGLAESALKQLCDAYGRWITAQNQDSIRVEGK